MTDSTDGADSTPASEQASPNAMNSLLEQLKSSVLAAEEAKNEIKAHQTVALEATQSLNVLKGELAALVDRAKADLSTLSGDVNDSRKAAQEAFKDGRAGIDTLKQAVQSLTDDVSTRTQAVEQKIAEALGAIETAKTTANQKLEELVESSNASAQSAGSHQASSKSAADTANQLLESMKVVAQSVAALKAEVDAHHVATRESVAAKQKFDEGAAKAFEAFDSVCEQARQRNVEFETKATEFRTEITRLIAHADAMVFGATTAGIATSFEKEVKRLDSGILYSTIFFVIGVAFLAVSLSPLIIHVLHAAPGQELGVGTVVARSIFLIPSGWFTLHFARRIHANFELRQQYVHKFSLAATLEPFRKAAGERGDQAVADAWGQLVKNPANLMRRHQRLGDGPAEFAGDLVSQSKKLIPSAKVTAQVD